MDKRFVGIGIGVMAMLMLSTGAVTPTGVTYSYPFNIINTQGTATSIGFQQQICGIPANALVGNILVYNSTSGATLPTWIENSTCVWTNLEGNTIGASGSANGIYDLGFGSSGTNFLIPGNNLGLNPIYGSSYGKYDNGKVVFNYYTNFTGTSLPSGWANYGVTNTISNGITISAGTGKTYYNTQDAYTGVGNVLDIFGKINSVSSGSSAAGYIDSYSTASYSVMSGLGYKSGFNWISGGFGGGFHTYSASLTGLGVMTANSIPQASYSGRTFNGMINYNSTTAILAAGTVGTGHTQTIGFLVSGSGQSFGPFYWVRIRTAPPNGVMPTIFYPLAPTPLPSISQPIISNSIIDIGQTQTISATISYGVANYIGNAIITNSIGITQRIAVPSQASHSLSSSWTIASNELGSETGNFVIYDSASNTTNSIPSASFTVYNALASVSISPSTTQSVNFGNSITFTSSVTGGAPPYTYQWRSDSSSCTGSSSPIGGATSNTYTASPATTTYYCLTVTDSATTNEILTSSNTEVKVSFIPYLNVLTPTIAPNSIQQLTAGISLGSGSYTYNILVYNSIGSLVYNSLSGATPATSDIVVFTQNPAWGTGTFMANAIITDSGGNSISTSLSYGSYNSIAYVTNYGSSNSSNVVIVNTATNSVVGSINSGFSYPAGVAFNPSGSFAYVPNVGSSNVVIVNTATNSVVGSINSGFSSPHGVAFNPSGSFAYVTNGGSSNVVIVNTATNSVVGSINSGFSYPYGVAFNPSGSFAYITNYVSSNVVIVNTATNSVVGSINSGFSSPYGVAFNPSGSFAYVTDYVSANIVIVNTATNSVVGSINSGFSSPAGVAFNPSGSFAYVPNVGSSNVVIVNTATNSVVGSIKSGFSSPYGVAFTNLPFTQPASSLSQPSISSPSNSIIDVGQYETFNTMFTGGTSPYTYNWIISNAVTGAVVYFNSISNALQTNTISFQIPQYFTTNSPLRANVIVTDANPTTVNSVYSANFMVSNQLFSTSWTASNAVLDYNQFQVLNGIISGGTSGFTYNILVYNAIGTLVFNSLSPYTYATSNVNVFLQQTVWGYGNFIANIFITDSAYSPVTASNTLTYVVESTSTTSTTTTTSTSTTSATTTVVSGGGGYQSTTSKSTTSLTTTTVPPTTVVGVLVSAWQIAGNTWTAFTAWIKPVYAMTFIQIPDWILAAVALMVVTIVVRNEKKDSRAYWVPALALIVVVALYFIA